MLIRRDADDFIGSDFLNYTIHKPIGVAGLIMPWNALETVHVALRDTPIPRMGLGD